jgi:hypothetical protein
MNRRRSVARGPRAPVTGAAGAPLQTLQSQLAGLKRKAAFRQTRPGPATSSDVTDFTPDDATTSVEHPHSHTDTSSPATAPHMSKTTAGGIVTPARSYVSETTQEDAAAPVAHPHAYADTFPSAFSATRDSGERTSLFKGSSGDSRPRDRDSGPQASNMASLGVTGAHASHVPSSKVSGFARSSEEKQRLGEDNASDGEEGPARHTVFHTVSHVSLAGSDGGHAGLHRGLHEGDSLAKEHRGSVILHTGGAHLSHDGEEEAKQTGKAPPLLHHAGSAVPDGHSADVRHFEWVSRAHNRGVSPSVTADPHGTMFTVGSTGRPSGLDSHHAGLGWDVRGGQGEWAGRTAKRGAEPDDPRVWHPSPSPLADLLACAREFFTEVALRRAGGRGVVEATFSSLGAHFSAVAARGPRVAALAGETIGRAGIPHHDAPDALNQMAHREVQFAHREAPALSHSVHAETSHAAFREHGGACSSTAVLSAADSPAHHEGPMGELVQQHHYSQARELSLDNGPGAGSAGRVVPAPDGEGGAQGDGGGAEGMGDAPGHGPTGPRGTHADQLQGQLAGLKRRAALRRPQS